MSILVNIRKFQVCCISRYRRLVEIVSTFGRLLGISAWNMELELVFSLPGVQIPGWNQVFACSLPLLLPLGLAFGRLVHFLLAGWESKIEKCRFPTVNTEEGLFWGPGYIFLVGLLDFTLSGRASVPTCSRKQGKCSGTHLGPAAFTAWEAYKHLT
ncbi:Hypothetical_protein [Hexamita inflata]|uniref:Hypothetical_protein n=1 Tax=Hexamita inflata TaxID=28002 RepID=A0AA86TLG8_9EUKA|nr:Hypothetical protein HINF_LOCUS5113 [Hexamita inflata]CAI9920965.1 Hypothetical protein HINF_LOCUS8610 [Hexamita inflata]